MQPLEVYSTLWERTGIKQETKLKVYQAVILPTLLYGCEAWTFYQHHARKLNHLHLSYLRKLLKNGKRVQSGPKKCYEDTLKA